MVSLNLSDIKINNCPTEQLNEILSKQSKSGMVFSVFKILNATKGIHCDNYLPWQDSFYGDGRFFIEGIQPKDLTKSVLWGIDGNKRSYIALKYTCDQLNEIDPNAKPIESIFNPSDIGAFVLFQRFANNDIGDSHYLAVGQHYPSESNCMKRFTHTFPYLKDNFLPVFTSLLTNDSATFPYNDWERQVTIIAKVSLA